MESMRANLDKTMTMSGWNRRPLSSNEIQYAAIDAFVTRLCFVECARILWKKPSRSEIQDRITMLVNASSAAKGKTVKEADCIDYDPKPTKEDLELISNTITDYAEYYS